MSRHTWIWDHRAQAVAPDVEDDGDVATRVDGEVVAGDEERQGAGAQAAVVGQVDQHGAERGGVVGGAAPGARPLRRTPRKAGFTLGSTGSRIASHWQ